MEMSIIETVKFILLIGTPLGIVCWHLYRRFEAKHDKMEARVEALEKGQNNLEKTIVEIKTEFKYVAKAIEEIKELLLKMSHG